jgi:hypothetical protein
VVEDYGPAKAQRPLAYTPVLLILCGIFVMTWDKGGGGCFVDEPCVVLAYWWSPQSTGWGFGWCRCGIMTHCIRVLLDETCLDLWGLHGGTPGKLSSYCAAK